MKSTALLTAAAAMLLTLAPQAAPQSPKPKAIWDRNEPLPKGFNPGEVFPSITLPSAADGRPMSLADFRGRKVIVNIFASW